MLIFSIQILVLCNPIFIENSYKNHLSNSNWDEDRILVYNWGKVEKNIYKKSPLFTNNNSKAFSSFSSLEKFLRPKTTYFVNEQQAVAVGHIIQLDNFKLKLIHNIFYKYWFGKEIEQNHRKLLRKELQFRRAVVIMLSLYFVLWELVVEEGSTLLPQWPYCEFKPITISHEFFRYFLPTLIYDSTFSLKPTGTFLFPSMINFNRFSKIFILLNL